MAKTAQQQQIPLDICATASLALEMGSAKQYQAVLADFDVMGARELLKCFSEGPDKPHRLALLPGAANLSEAFATGATLAIHKPLAGPPVRHTLKAAYGLGSPIRRNSQRATTRLPSLVAMRGADVSQGSTVNISQQGACLAVDRKIVPGTFMTVRFAFPGSSLIDLGAMAVWNVGRSVGVRFLRVCHHHGVRIRDWIHAAR